MKKSNDLFSELIVGLFMVAVISLLAYFTIVISGVDILRGRERVRAVISFSDVAGLKERDNVVYRGMKVGTVDRIELAGENISVTVSVDKDVVLRDGYNITVASLSLLGGNYLLLEEGKGDKLPIETTMFKIKTKMLFFGELTTACVIFNRSFILRNWHRSIIMICSSIYWMFSG